MKNFKTMTSVAVLAFALTATSAHACNRYCNSPGEMYGAATTMVLDANGIPRPLAEVIGRYQGRNAEIALRESTVVGAEVARQTGISIDDIKRHGIRGGRCSVLNNPFGRGC